MDSALQKRIERAHVLHSAGHGTSEIAQQYKVTTRTVRRWLATTIDDEVQEQIELASKEDLEKFAVSAWRNVHKLVRQIEEKLDAGEFKSKDLAITLGILIDKVRQIAPSVVEEETETVKTVFTMTCPAKEEERARELFEEWKTKYLAGETIKSLTGEVIGEVTTIEETVEDADIEEVE